MMNLGISITPFGHHPAGWRGKSHSALRFDHMAAQVKKAQEGAFDFVFFDDRLGQRPVDDLSPQAVPFEPTTLIAALATIADTIGLIATADTGQHEPYNLARRFASLDVISKGRTGWNLVTSKEGSTRDDEYVDVINGLWDSWDDDAFAYDKAAGRFFMPEKMRVLNHKGRHFTVRGPLNVNRSPQGKPVISHLLTRGTLDIAARWADLVFINAQSLDEARALVSDFAERLDHHQRGRLDVRILANVIAYTGATIVGARQSYEELNTYGRVPAAGFETVGTPVETVDLLQEWFENGGVDGFIVLPPRVPEHVDAFIDAVIPELRKRGLVRTRYAGTTLREHLGLRRPSHAADETAGALR